MDSLTQIALGAAVGTAVLGRKAGPKAALWGAVCGTLPDLDVLVPYGDPVRDFTFHRAESHSLFWLTLVSPALAWLIHRLHRNAGTTFRDWLLLVWLALVTHALLDAFTIYGTQLLLPFSDYPVGVGSIFIIDPLYTLPLIVGVLAALGLRARGDPRAARWNAAGLVVSALYLGWTVAAQSHVEGALQRSLGASALADGRALVTPTPFNSVLWRVLVMDDGAYHEGFYSLLDDRDTVELVRHRNETELLEGVETDWTVRRLAWFSKGFFAVAEADGTTEVASGSAGTLNQLFGAVETAAADDAIHSTHSTESTHVRMTDLRMGQTPWFVFSFIVAERRDGSATVVPSRQVPTRRPPPDALLRLWARVWDENATLR